MKLHSPLKWRIITQPFGANLVPFYHKIGLIGHNGNDFRAPVGTKLFACFSGKISSCGTDRTGGKFIRILSDYKEDDGTQYDAIYYHLNHIGVENNEKVKAGQEIGLSGNTGKYTTGAHLHFGIKKRKNGRVVNYKNGYWGCFDPFIYTPFICVSR